MIRRLLQLLSVLALVGVIAPPILFLVGMLPLDRVHFHMMLATALWFAATPFWMGRTSA